MSDSIYHLLLYGTLETLFMVGFSGLCSVLFGLPVGVILFITQNPRIFKNIWLHTMLSSVVNILRAIPFIILLVILIPVTRWLVGTTIGTLGPIVPLTIGAIPFVARLVESALVEVHHGVIEAGQAMGVTHWQLIYKILLPEARPAIIRGITLTWISLLGYSAMAGAVGGGGLGSLAINYGYQRFDLKILWSTVIALVLLVYGIQWLGERLAKHWEH